MHCDIQACHKIVLPKEKCFTIISHAHEAVGHWAIYSTLTNIQERFWWPMLEDNVKWFVSMCHPCQTHQLCHLHIPPVVPDVLSLFWKAHIDTMLMPTVNKFCYIVQAHCALSSWPEWCPLPKENEKTLGDFIFELWGAPLPLGRRCQNCHR